MVWAKPSSCCSTHISMDKSQASISKGISNGSRRCWCQVGRCCCSRCFSQSCFGFAFRHSNLEHHLVVLLLFFLFLCNDGWKLLLRVLMHLLLQTNALHGCQSRQKDVVF